MKLNLIFKKLFVYSEKNLVMELILFMVKILRVKVQCFRVYTMH